jgi:hypothetical protein
MQRELTQKDSDILEDNIFTIACIYSNIELVRQGILGGDIVELSDINRTLYLIENEMENAMKNISSTLGANFLKMN